MPIRRRCIGGRSTHQRHLQWSGNRLDWALHAQGSDMLCRDCIHWTTPRSVDPLPGYPIGFCEIFQKDVAGELAGCAGRYYLSRNREEWHGSLHEKETPANAPVEIPQGAKIVSIEASAHDCNIMVVTYLMPDN